MSAGAPSVRRRYSPVLGFLLFPLQFSLRPPVSGVAVAVYAPEQFDCHIISRRRHILFPFVTLWRHFSRHLSVVGAGLCWFRWIISVLRQIPATSFY